MVMEMGSHQGTFWRVVGILALHKCEKRLNEAKAVVLVRSTGISGVRTGDFGEATLFRVNEWMQATACGVGKV
jgi:hypothetical protein